MKIGIVIPTYNEAKNVPLLLGALKKEASKIKDIDFTIAVVDDNSPDDTSKITKQTGKALKSKNFSVVVVDRTIKDGYGKACIEGMEYLLSKKVDFVMSMDADLSHNPIYLKDFVEALKTSDLIVGSRYVTGGDTPDWPILRKVLSRYGNYYARLFLGAKISDYTGGFNLYAKDLLRKIDLDNIKSTGYGFLIELKYKASLEAKDIHQVPIVFHDRKHGKSKIPKNTIVKNLILVPKLRFQVSKKLT